MYIVETERLNIRRLNATDAGFILQLVNQPDWLKYIGDKQIHSIDAAKDYIEKGPVSMYRKYGYGLYSVELKGSLQSIGICGLIKRDYLPEPDLGFAFLPEYYGNGYAYESALALLNHAIKNPGTKKLAAIVTADNLASVKLLEKLGFVFEQSIKDEFSHKPVNLYRYS